MSLLVDTGVFYAALYPKDRHHDDARALLAEAMAGTHGTIHSTTFVVDELLTLLQTRRCPWADAERALSMMGITQVAEIPEFVRMLDVGPADLAPSAERHARHWERGLSFTDCTNLHVMARDEIDALATFDQGFDGLVPVVP